MDSRRRHLSSSFFRFNSDGSVAIQLYFVKPSVPSSSLVTGRISSFDNSLFFSEPENAIFISQQPLNCDFRVSTMLSLLGVKKEERLERVLRGASEINWFSVAMVLPVALRAFPSVFRFVVNEDGEQILPT